MLRRWVGELDQQRLQRVSKAGEILRWQLGDVDEGFGQQLVESK